MGGGGGGGGPVTIGYHYGLSIHYAIAHDVDSLLDVYVAGKTLLNYRNDKPVGGGRVTIQVDKPNVFGGESGEGGVFGGQWHLEYGGPNQTPNPYLATFQNPLPAYRHFFGIVLEKVVHQAFNPYLKKWSFLVRRMPKGIGNWDAAAHPTNIGLEDANPAAIIYETLVNNEWGLGYDPNGIDITSFYNAATTLRNEGFGMSLALRDINIKDFVDDVLRHIDGVLFQNLETGLLEIKLLRNDYDASNLDILNDNIVTKVLSIERPQWYNQTNDVIIVYTDPNSLREAAINVQDLGSIYTIGKKTQRIEFLGVTNRQIAYNIGMRELARSSRLPLTAKVETDATPVAFKIGDPLLLNLPKYNINNVIMRLMEREVYEDGRCVLTLKEDIYQSQSYDLTIGDSGWVPPPNYDPTNAADVWVYTDFTYTYWHWAKFIGSPPYTDPNRAANYCGTVRAETYVTGTNVYKKDLVVNGVNVAANSTPVLHASGTAGGGEAAAIAKSDTTLLIVKGIDTQSIANGNTILVYEKSDRTKTEIMQVISNNGSTLDVARGVLDTHPKDFARPYFIDLHSFSGEGLQTDVGDQYEYRFDTVTTTGTTTGTARVAVLEQRLSLPYGVKNVTYRMASGMPAAPDHFPVYISLVTGTFPLDIKWSNSNKLFGDNTNILNSWLTHPGFDPETGTNAYVEIYCNGTLVHQSGPLLQDNFSTYTYQYLGQIDPASGITSWNIGDIVRFVIKIENNGDYNYEDYVFEATVN